MKTIYYAIQEHEQTEKELADRIKKINELVWEVKFLRDLKGHLEDQITYLQTYDEKSHEALEIETLKIANLNK
ncbi:MAG: hypothetical protein ACRC42_04910 [Mycoplasma sp.]